MLPTYIDLHSRNPSTLPPSIPSPSIQHLSDTRTNDRLQTYVILTSRHRRVYEYSIGETSFYVHTGVGILCK